MAEPFRPASPEHTFESIQGPSAAGVPRVRVREARDRCLDQRGRSRRSAARRVPGSRRSPLRMVGAASTPRTTWLPARSTSKSRRAATIVTRVPPAAPIAAALGSASQLRSPRTLAVFRIQGGNTEPSQSAGQSRRSNAARTACADCPSALTTTPPPPGRALSPSCMPLSYSTGRLVGNPMASSDP